MNPYVRDNWPEIERLLDEALDLAPASRLEFLRRIASQDPNLAAEVHRLLRASEASADFLGEPAATEAASLVAWATDAPPIQTGTRFGPYEITRLIGRGGMATVYLAHDHKHHRQVAMKVLHTELAAVVGPDWFLREIDIAATLHHPHILPLHDSGTADGRLYYVMPYVDGESLRQRLARDGPLPVDDAVRIAHEVAGALDHAHRQGIVHRDIKPENILLQDGQAIVADFGIARAIHAAGAEQVPQKGFPTGTPAYMSPEQGSGTARLDARADVYSLGCVVFEMLAGEPPFRGVSTEAILAKHAQDPAPALGTRRLGIPPAVEQAVARALRKSPSDRFPTARAFVQALAGIPTAVREPASSASQHRRWLIAGGAGLILLTAGLAVVRARRPDEPIARPVPAQRPSEDQRSIAVLPFLSLSADKQDEYFSDGMTDELINALGKIQGLKVAARASTFTFKGRPADPSVVSKRLHVATMLDGTVKKEGNRLRVSVELVRTGDGRRIWSETYDRSLTDVFTVQEELARAITSALELKLATPEGTPIVARPTNDLEAYTLYLKGRYYSYSLEPQERRRAVHNFRKAVERDSNYALAWAGLADAYSQVASAFPPWREFPALQEKARTAARRAVALDSTVAESHAALGNIQYWFDRNWGPAEQSLRRALALNPNDALAHRWYSELLVYLRRYPEAISEAERAEALDPVNPFMMLGTSWVYTEAGQLKRADEALSRWLELDSTSATAYGLLGRVQVLEGRRNEAFANLKKAADLAEPGHDSLIKLLLAYAYAATGHREEARMILRTVEQPTTRSWPPNTDFAAVYVALGDLNAALGWLERGYAAHDDGIAGIAGLPWLEPLRGDPRFTHLLRRMRLPA